MATFDVDDLYVDTGIYAWVYQNQTGPVDVAAERVDQDGQLFPTYPQFNPRLVRLENPELYDDSDSSSFKSTVGVTVLTWKNIVVYQTKQRRTQIRPSRETLKRRIVEYKCKNMWHLEENTIPNVPDVPENFHNMLRGELTPNQEEDIVRALSIGFDRASGEDCVRATKYAKCGCNQDGEPLTLRFGDVMTYDEYDEELGKYFESINKLSLSDIDRAKERILKEQSTVSGRKFTNEQLAQIKKALVEVRKQFNDAENLLLTTNKSRNKKKTASGEESASGEETASGEESASGEETASGEESASGVVDTRFDYERPPNDAALDALTGLMDGMNMVDETSDEEEAFDEPAIQVPNVALLGETSDEEETFDEPATQVPNVALLGETSDEEETFDEPAAELSESSIPSAVYATTSDDDFSAPAGHLSEAESEQSQRSMLYATTSDDEFSAPAGQLSDVSSEVSSEAGDIPSAAFTTSSAPSNMYASTSDTEDDVSTTELGWTASTPVSNNMYVSSSDAGDDLMSLTKDM